MGTIPLIISVLLFILGIASLLYAQSIETDKTKINNYRAHEKRKIDLFIEDEERKLSSLKIDVSELFNKRESLQKEYLQKEKDAKDSYESYQQVLQTSLEDAQNEFNINIKKIQQEQEEQLAELEKLKNLIAAGVQAKLREQEEQNKIDFYKLTLSVDENNDVEKLEELRKNFSHPDVISKLIWSQYYQKKTTDLCNRIFGTSIVTGIYKITNLKTEQVYIGQAKDMSKRIKEHIKCGLGIDTPSTNKLYKAMLEYGIQNFTFELLEKCSSDLLNETERRWIEIYQSNKFGYNITLGINK